MVGHPREGAGVFPMSTLALATTHIARGIGRWILRRLLERVGKVWLTRYLSRKIRVFKRRAKAAAEAGRGLYSIWNQRRAARWTAARAWLLKNWLRLTQSAIKRLDDEIAAHVPDQVPCENWEQWARDLEGQDARAALQRMGLPCG